MAESENLSRFGARQKALLLFDWVVRDLAALTKGPALQRLIAQRIALCDEIIGILTAPIRRLRAQAGE